MRDRTTYLWIGWSGIRDRPEDQVPETLRIYDFLTESGQQTMNLSIRTTYQDLQNVADLVVIVVSTGDPIEGPFFTKNIPRCL